MRFSDNRMKDECDYLAECLLKELTDTRAALYREPVYPTAAEEHDSLVRTIARFIREEIPRIRPRRRVPTP